MADRRLIRVFPRKTKASPDDELAYFGPPDLFAAADEVHISVLAAPSGVGRLVLAGTFQSHSSVAQAPQAQRWRRGRGPQTMAVSPVGSLTTVHVMLGARAWEAWKAARR